MNFWPTDETTTRTFARVLGPYYVIVCGSGLEHKQSALPLLSDIGVWPWATGCSYSDGVTSRRCSSR